MKARGSEAMSGTRDAYRQAFPSHSPCQKPSQHPPATLKQHAFI